MRHSTFEEIGGFDEQMLKFYDVDLCLRLRQKGYLIVWTPYAEVRSANIGDLPLEDHAIGSDQEALKLRRRWGELLQNDPYYNPNLSVYGTGFTPAFPPRLRKPWIAEKGFEEIVSDL